MSLPRLLPGLSPPLRRLVVALCAMEFLEWTGGGAIVPLLPTYLRAHGSSPVLVGLVMGSYFAAGMLTQFPLGRLIDRVGPRRVVLFGLVLFGCGCVGFALLPGAASGIAFRALQGTGAGSVTVASAATIGRALPSGRRGPAFGALYGAQTLALAIGPLAGSAIGASSMRWLFIAAALAAAGAALPALAYLPASWEGRGPASRPPRPAFGSPTVLGAAVVFVAVGLLGGMYEACWSLLLHLRGATSLEIGLSWTLYCLPFALLSVGSGRLAERADRRALAAGGIVASAIFACIYPLLHSVVALVTLGTAEAFGAVLVTPAALSALSGAVATNEQGAAQGFVGSARTGANAVGAAGCGSLFALSARLPFFVTGVVLGILAGVVVALWRRLPLRAVEGPDNVIFETGGQSGIGPP